jgi:hypothetical protein
VRVLAGTAVQYVGKVTDWNFSFEPNGRQSAELQAADGFTFLAQQDLTPGTATAQLTGARVNAVLSQASVDWPWRIVTLIRGTVSWVLTCSMGTCSAICRRWSSLRVGSCLLISRGGWRFRDRLTTPTVDNVTVFADDGTGIPFAPAALDYGTEQLLTR